jgi:lysozyme
MTLTYRGALELASHEALVRQTYKDSVGVLTWAVGMTNATGHKVERYIGRPAPLQHCMNVYAWALKNYAKQVDEAFAGHKLNEHQYAAALSFHWNTGAIKRATWVQYFKRGDIAKARTAFMNWTKPSEITRRRAAERDLFFDGKWSNNGTMTEYTRVRPNMQPDWSSAKRISVDKELRAAFANTPPVTIDQPAQPDVVPQVPTLTPSAVNPGAFVLVALLIAAGATWVVNKLRGKRQADSKEAPNK